MMKTMSLTLLALGITMNVAAQTPEFSGPDGLRKGGTLTETLSAPPMAGEPRHSGREVRNYPQQPPVIPHTIRKYQVDTRMNRCLECHSRDTAPELGAPMISITHYTDRDGQTRAAVTPNRYFCTQCHVPQTDAKPLVESDFRSIDDILRNTGSKQPEAGAQR